MSPKNIAKLKPQDSVHIDLIGPYKKPIIQHYPGRAIISNNATLACITKINPATGCSKIVKIPMFDLDEVTIFNYECMDKSSARVIHMFNNTWLYIYPHPQKVMLDN